MKKRAGGNSSLSHFLRQAKSLGFDVVDTKHSFRIMSGDQPVVSVSSSPRSDHTGIYRMHLRKLEKLAANKDDNIVALSDHRR